MEPTPDIEVAFEGKATENNELDADFVAASIVGVQKAVRMIASANTEGWSGDRRKYRPTKAVREAVVVRVAAPRAGSLVLPMSVQGAGTGGQSDLLDTFGRFFDWLAGDDDRRPDLAGNVLDHLLRSALDWIPTRSDLTMKLRLRGTDHRSLTSATRERAQELLELGSVETIRLIGEVTRAYLDEGQVRLRHPPSRRTFRVDVPQDVRAKLSLARGQWVEVVGRFRCDLRGDPVEVSSVDTLDLPDLAPISLAEVELERTKLRVTRPITLAVSLDEETHQLYVVRDERLGIHAFAYDRAELLPEVKDQVRFLWTNYGAADRNELAPDALLIQRQLQEAFTEDVP